MAVLRELKGIQRVSTTLNWLLNRNNTAFLMRHGFPNAYTSQSPSVSPTYICQQISYFQTKAFIYDLPIKIPSKNPLQPLDTITKTQYFFFPMGNFDHD